MAHIDTAWLIKFQNLFDVYKLHLSVIIVTLFLLVVILFVLYLRERRKNKNRLTQLKRAVNVSEKVQSNLPLEQNLNVILEMFSYIVKGVYYAFYVLDNRGDKFLLRAAIHPYDDFTKVQPSYSGLALPRKEVYIPPTTMEVNKEQTTFNVVQIEEADFVLLMTLSRNAAIRIGPVRKLNRKTKRNLRSQLKAIESKIEEIIEVSRQRTEKRVTITADNAVRTLSSIATSLDSALEIMMRSMIGEAGGIGGTLIDLHGNQVIKVDFDDTLSKLFEKIQEDHHFQNSLHEWLNGREYYVVSSNDKDYYSLPEYIVSQGIGAIIVVSIPGRGLLVMFFDLEFEREEFLKLGMAKVSMLSDVLRKIAKEHGERKWMAKVYTQQLKQMTDAVELVNPYTVGYSEMVAHFSLAIGNEMGLAENVMEDLALASYFSNIGTLGMDHRVFNKQGRLSEAEFEQVKLHSEIGAAMILIATGNRRASEFVLYHHERMDGNGYPSGLQQDEIPIGARIIHAVQFFMAKINGRSWRSPITFVKALEMVKEMGGSQLDYRVVDALSDWYLKKASDTQIAGKSLDVCYKLLSVPDSICKNCPVFEKVNVTSVNCWEVGNHLCRAHGRSCETCFIRTEAMERNRAIRMNGPSYRTN